MVDRSRASNETQLRAGSLLLTDLAEALASEGATQKRLMIVNGALTIVDADAVEQAAGGGLETFRTVITSDDLTAAATSQVFPVTLPVGARPVAFGFGVLEAFVGLTAPTVNVDGALSGSSIVAAGSLAFAVRATTPMVQLILDETINVEVVDTATNLDQATAGSFEFITYYTTD